MSIRPVNLFRDLPQGPDATPTGRGARRQLVSIPPASALSAEQRHALDIAGANHGAHAASCGLFVTLHPAQVGPLIDSYSRAGIPSKPGLHWEETFAAESTLSQGILDGKLEGAGGAEKSEAARELGTGLKRLATAFDALSTKLRSIGWSEAYKANKDPVEARAAFDHWMETDPEAQELEAMRRLAVGLAEALDRLDTPEASAVLLGFLGDFDGALLDVVGSDSAQREKYLRAWTGEVGRNIDDTLTELQRMGDGKPRAPGLVESMQFRTSGPNAVLRTVAVEGGGTFRGDKLAASEVTKLLAAPGAESEHLAALLANEVLALEGPSAAIAGAQLQVTERELPTGRTGSAIQVLVNLVNTESQTRPPVGGATALLHLLSTLSSADLRGAGRAALCVFDTLAREARSTLVQLAAVDGGLAIAARLTGDPELADKAQSLEMRLQTLLPAVQARIDRGEHLATDASVPAQST